MDKCVCVETWFNAYLIMYTRYICNTYFFIYSNSNSKNRVKMRESMKLFLSIKQLLYMYIGFIFNYPIYYYVSKFLSILLISFFFFPYIFNLIFLYFTVNLHLKCENRYLEKIIWITYHYDVNEHLFLLKLYK